MPPRSTASQSRSSAPAPKRSDASRFNDLPLELLTEVFITWSHVDEDAPWTAATTCRHWRSVALDAGQMWSSLTLRLESTPTKKYEWSPQDNDYAFITYRTWNFRSPALWIERSRRSDLSIVILANSLTKQAATALQKVVFVLKGHLPRLRRLTLSTAEPEIVATFLEMLYRGTTDPELDYLKVVVGAETASLGMFPFGYPYRAHMRRFWSLAPQARTLAFNLCLPLKNAHGSTPSEAHELVLENAPLDGHGLIEQLQDFPYLRKLCLDGIILAPKGPVPNIILSMQHLNSLSLHAVSTRFCRELFGHLETPNLVSLSLENHGMDELHELWKRQEGKSWSQVMEPFGKALEVFAQKTSSLHSLRLRLSPIDDHHFLRVLQALPELQELTLELSLAGSPALRGLTPRKAAEGKTYQVPCPRLQRLYFKDCSAFKKAPLLDLLSMRCDPDSQCPPINDISIMGCEGLEDIATDIRSVIGSSPCRITVS